MEYTLPDLYEVEKIINCKYFNHKKYYLIKWLCYPINQSTWEPKSNLKNLNYLIEQFEAQYPNTIDKSMYNIFCNEMKYKYKKKGKKEGNKKSINSHLKYLSRKRNIEVFPDKDLNNINLDKLKIHLHIKIDKNELNKIQKEKQDFFIDLSESPNNSKSNSLIKEANENTFEDNRQNLTQLIKPNII